MLAKTLIENVSDAVVIIDNDTKIVGVNDAACDLFQTPRDELIGKLPQEIVAKPNPFRIEKFGSRLADKNTVEGKLPLLMEDGRVSQIEYKAFANVEPDRHLVIFRDISGQKRAEKQTEAFLKLGRLLSAAATAEAAAQVIATVSDELFGWDACFFDLYIPETDSVDPLLSMDIIDGKRQNIVPVVSSPPSPIGRRTMEEGKQLIFFEEDDNFEGLIPFGDEERLSASLMFVPVRDGDHVIGVFSIQSYAQYAYTYEDLDTLQALADYCGGAFHRIRGEALLARSNHRLITIREIEQAILEARSPVEIAETALHRIKDIIAYDRGSIILFDQSSGKARSLVVTGFGADDTILTETILDQLNEEFFDLITKIDYRIVDDIDVEKKFEFIEFLDNKGLKSFINVPLVVGKVLFGMLNLASTQRNAFKQEDAEVGAPSCW
jgi:PAS domain S-box-containing protein